MQSVNPDRTVRFRARNGPLRQAADTESGALCSRELERLLGLMDTMIVDA